MEEFFDLEGTTGIVELHMAAEIIGVSMIELRKHKNYIQLDTDLPEVEQDYGFEPPILDTDWDEIKAIYHL